MARAGASRRTAVRGGVLARPFTSPAPPLGELHGRRAHGVGILSRRRVQLNGLTLRSTPQDGEKDQGPDGRGQAADRVDVLRPDGPQHDPGRREPQDDGETAMAAVVTATSAVPRNSALGSRSSFRYRPANEPTTDPAPQNVISKP